MNVSIAGLYVDHIGEIRRFLARKLSCRDTAAELAHEVFVRFLAAAPETDIAHPRAFLYRIADHLAIDHFRRQAPWQGKSVDISECVDLPSDTPSPERYVAARQQLDRLRRAIEALPPRCKEAFLRHKFDGIPQKTLAMEYGITVNAIEKLLVRALVQLRLSVEWE